MVERGAWSEVSVVFELWMAGGRRKESFSREEKEEAKGKKPELLLWKGPLLSPLSNKGSRLH
jgi:3'-phosphoadenosine 5'-phosphosulfate sulfotransferase (PAPS reductase)/FAD synthetase